MLAKALKETKKESEARKQEAIINAKKYDAENEETDPLNGSEFTENPANKGVGGLTINKEAPAESMQIEARQNKIPFFR